MPPVFLTVLVYGAATLAASLLASFAGLDSLFAPPLEGRGVVSLLAGSLLAAIIVLGGRRLEQHAWYARMADILAGAVKTLLGPRGGLSEQLVVALASSLGEETFFRGFCQPGLA